MTEMNPEMEQAEMGQDDLEVCNIATGTVINGDMKVPAHLRLEGKIYGNINCTGRLVLAPTAVIEGDIECESLISEGTIKGESKVENEVFLLETANQVGDLTCGRLQVDEGAVFNGKCVMKGKG